VNITLGKAVKVKQLLKQNASAKLTRELLNVPEGGKTITVGDKKIRVTVSKTGSASRAK
jgi:topoisomerase IA-like protein